MKTNWFRCCAVLLLACGGVRAETLQDELASVQAKIEEVRRAISDQARQLWEIQQKADITNQEVAVLREDIRRLEGELAQKRQELSRYMRSQPEIQALDQKRRAQFEELQALMEKERLIKNELAAAPVTTPPDEKEGP